MSARKKLRGPQARLTHFEVRRGSHLRLRLAIADDAIAEVGDELGRLFVAIAPNAVSTHTIGTSAPRASVIAADAPGAIEVVSAPSPAEIGIAPDHTNDDAAYHASVRGRLTDLFGSLCDASLADALEIAREERARRAEGGN